MLLIYFSTGLPSGGDDRQYLVHVFSLVFHLPQHRGLIHFILLLIQLVSNNQPGDPPGSRPEDVLGHVLSVGDIRYRFSHLIDHVVNGSAIRALIDLGENQALIGNGRKLGRRIQHVFPARRQT